METIEKEILNYLRLALYGLKNKDIAVRIDSSKTTVTNFLSNEIGTKETQAKLMILAKEVSPNLPIPEPANA